MKSYLQPSLISSSFSLEKFKPKQSNPIPCLSITKKTLPAPPPFQESQEPEQDCGQNGDLFICISESTFDSSPPQEEIVDSSKDIAYDNLIDGKMLGSIMHKDIQNKLENNEIESISTQDEQSQDQNDQKIDREGQILHRSIDKLRVEKSQKHKKSAKVAKKSQPKKIIDAVFNSEMQEVLFKVECCAADSNKTEINYLAKDEVIETDPRLLLYFYESHLQFKRTPDFQACKLKTV